MYFDKKKQKKQNKTPPYKDLNWIKNKAAIHYKIRLKTFPTSSL